MASLFDTPEEVMQQRALQGREQAMMNNPRMQNAGAVNDLRSQVRQNRSADMRSGAVGNMAQTLMPNANIVPELKKAYDIKNIREKVNQNFKFGTPEYFEAVSTELANAGHPDAALKAKEASMNFMSKDLSIQKDKLAIEAAKKPAERKTKKAFLADGKPVFVTEDQIASNPDLFFPEDPSEEKPDVSVELDQERGLAYVTDSSGNTAVKPIANWDATKYSKEKSDLKPDVKGIVVNGEDQARFFNFSDLDQAEMAMELLNKKGGSILNPNKSQMEGFLEKSGLSEEEKTEYRQSWLDSQLANKGFEIVHTDKGTTIRQGGSPKGTEKLDAKFKENKAVVMKYNSLANKIISGLKKNPTTAGLSGTLQRLAGSIKSQAKNLGMLTGLNAEEYDKIANKENYDLSVFKIPKGISGAAAAAYQTNMFTLALMYAGASGLGEGKALSDADVKNAMRAIGADSQDPEAVIAKIQTSGMNLIENFRIDQSVEGRPMTPVNELLMQEGKTDLSKLSTQELRDMLEKKGG